MFASVSSPSILGSTAESVSLRALLAIALAFVALAVIDRMKPATPRRTIAVRVDKKPTPLYKDPDPQHRLRTAASLSAGAVVAGAVIACLVGFVLTIALELVGGLLRS